MDVINQAEGLNWKLVNADSTEALKSLPDNSVDLSVFSPPFQLLFTYSSSDRDLGNAKTVELFWEHYKFIIDELLRVTKPGRNCCVHVAQIATTKAHHGVIGLQDFRGENIRAYMDAGWVYHGEVCIDKDPQAQAIRTHSKALLFVQKAKDSSWLRPALADYILVFRKDGENAVPVTPDITNNEWIEWARPIWYGIRETDTLNAAEGKTEEDERHICPLQLGTIERCIRLWSNPGEIVLSPFCGIGSEVYEAILLGRKGLGIELKPEYFSTATVNCQRAESMLAQKSLFGAEDLE
jgi:DNA modification methylase